MYSIYKITNKINGKCYIGQTKNSIQRRFICHKSDTKCSMYDVINKYGCENFSIELIDRAEDKNTAIDKETFWTLFFKSDNPEYGYNRRVGNSGLFGEKNPNYGKILPQEVRTKISHSLKGKFAGNKNPQYGKHPSEEILNKLRGKNHWTTRKRISEESLKKKHDALYRKPSGRSIPVRCIETGEVLPFAKEFYYKYGYLDSKILECCKGRRKTHKGMHWEYAVKE